MKRHKQTPERLIELGTASRRTRGAEGTVPDFVRMMKHWGISRD